MNYDYDALYEMKNRRDRAQHNVAREKAEQAMQFVEKHLVDGGTATVSSWQELVQIPGYSPIHVFPKARLDTLKQRFPETLTEL
jgi:hypothetical protein